MSDTLTDAAFRVVVEEAPDAIVLVDAAGCIAYINTQSEHLFGYERSELLGQRVELLVPEDMRPMHATHREVYQERPERRPMGIGLQLAARRKDGSTFPVEISLSPFYDGDTQLSVAVVRDVTRQRRAEETLRRSEERHRLLNERAENVIFRYRLTPMPGFEYVSSSVHARLGYAPEEFYVDDGLVFRITHVDDRHVMEQALSAAAPKNVSLRIMRRDGAVRWFEFSVTAVPNADGIVVALEGIARDVTDRRVADEERLRLQSEVEMQLERSRIAGDLHDDTIQSIYALGLGLHAIRDDESVTREAAVDRTVSGLNAIIAALRSYMERLSGQEESPAEAESLAARVSALVGDDGSPDWKTEIEPDLDLPPALARQVYLLSKELVSNVQRHAQASCAALSLKRDGQGHVQLVVTDDGIGFDREAVGAESFGLRSVEMRAKTLDAQLEIDSTPGKGTRVAVLLPIMNEAATLGG